LANLDLVAGGPANGQDVDAWEAEVRKAVTERDRLEWELGSELEKAGVFGADIEASAVSRALAGDAAGGAYLRYPRRFPADPQTGAAKPAEDSLLAFLVHPGGQIERVELGRCDELEELVRAWRSALGTPVSGRGIGASDSASSLAADELGTRLR